MDALSDKIIKKIDDVIKNENERKLVKELLEKTGKYSTQTNSLSIKKEFQLLVDQYFPFEDKQDG